MSVGMAWLVRFGTDPATFRSEILVYSYAALSVVLILAWFSALVLSRSREQQVVASGEEEYRRVARATTGLFGTVAVASYLLKLEIARRYLTVELPLGLLSPLLTRGLWRKWLVEQRPEDRFLSTVVVVGSHRAAAAMTEEFEPVKGAGYRVAGVCVPGWGTGKGDSVNVDGHPVPVLGDETAVIDALKATGTNGVAVSNPEYLGTGGMRALAWELEAVDADLVVAPGVIDVAAPRYADSSGRRITIAPRRQTSVRVCSQVSQIGSGPDLRRNLVATAAVAALPRRGDSDRIGQPRSCVLSSRAHRAQRKAVHDA
jgi:FlaA1/EpsC-like NDP-sugar epimerase